MENQIGQKIRYLRKKTNITLDVLAKRTGVTKGYLSKIERGLQSPPIATLSKISRALDVEIADFFQTRTREARCALVRKDERKPVIREGSAYEYLYEAIAYKNHSKKMTPFVITLPPKAKNHTAFTHQGEEMIFVLEGVMEFWFDDERYIVGPGDCIYFDSQVPHLGQCAGEEETKALVVIYSSKDRIE